MLAALLELRRKQLGTLQRPPRPPLRRRPSRCTWSNAGIAAAAGRYQGSLVHALERLLQKAPQILRRGAIEVETSKRCPPNHSWYGRCRGSTCEGSVNAAMGRRIQIVSGVPCLPSLVTHPRAKCSEVKSSRVCVVSFLSAFWCAVVLVEAETMLMIR